MALGLAYSHSRLKNFECPYRFRQLYIEKRKEPRTMAALEGDVKHQIMAKYLGYLYQEQRNLAMEALRGIAREVLEGVSYPPELRTAENRQKLTDSVNEMVTNLNMVRGGWCLDGIVGVPEYWIEGKVTFDSGWNVLPPEAWFGKGYDVYFRAIVDWMYYDNGEVVIVDHKSGWGEPDKEQLKIYSWCALRMMEAVGHSAKNISFIRVKYNLLAKNGLIDEKTFYSPDEAACFRDDIDRKIKIIENNTKWDATPCGQCSWCGFKDECPAMDKAWTTAVSTQGNTPLMAIQTKEDAEKGLLLHLMVDARLSALKKALQDWVEKNGPIVAGGKIMEQREKSQWESPGPYKIMKALSEIGIPPVDALATIGFSPYNIKKILRAGDAIRKQDLSRHSRDILALGKWEREKQPPSIYVAK